MIGHLPAVPARLGPTPAVVRRITVAAVVAEDGILRVTWPGGMRLIVPPDPGYEAWQLVGPYGLLVVCRPGGGLAIWQPRDARPA